MLSRARYWAVQEPQERLAKLLRTYSWQDEAEQIWPSHLKTVPCEASGITIASEAATTAITSPAAAMRPRTRALPAGGVVRLFGSVVAEIVSRSFMILSVRESDAGLRARHHLCYTAMRNIIPPRDSPPSDAITALRSAGPDASRRVRAALARPAPGTAITTSPRRCVRITNLPPAGVITVVTARQNGSPSQAAPLCAER